MEIPPGHPAPRRPRGTTSPLSLLLASTALLGSLACASPGPPRPPTLHIPAAVHDLAADRLGNSVVLHWTTPSDTSDRLPLRGALSAELCREVAPTPGPLTAPAVGRPAQPAPRAAPSPSRPLGTSAPSSTGFGASPPVETQPTSQPGASAATPGSAPAGPASPAPSGGAPGATPAGSLPAPPPSATPVCALVATLAVQPGASEHTDPLPPDLLTGPPRLLTYRVVIRSIPWNRAGDPSPGAFAASGPAPAAPADLLAATAARGVRLTWQPAPAPFPGAALTVEVTRRTLPDPNAPAPHPQASAAKPVTLIPGPHPSTDPGGMLDTTAARNTTYLYQATRYERFRLAGQSVSLRSLPSPERRLLVAEPSTPEAPTGLIAAPTPTSTAPGAPVAVDLSWEPLDRLDLAGYLVFRAPAGTSAHVLPPDAPWVRLTPVPIVPAAFHDQPPAPGAWLYRVVSVTAGGVLSPGSAVASAETR